MSRDLIFQGSDVRLVRRLERGKVLVAYLKRGEPTGLTDDAWPHQLRGHPDGLAGIRKMIAALPDKADAPTPDTDRQQDARPRSFLFAHHAAAHEREDDK